IQRVRHTRLTCVVGQNPERAPVPRVRSRDGTLQEFVWYERTSSAREVLQAGELPAPGPGRAEVPGHAYRPGPIRAKKMSVGPFLAWGAALGKIAAKPRRGAGGGAVRRAGGPETWVSRHDLPRSAE